MQQLTGLDTSFLVMEAGGQLGHVGSLCLYDPKGLRGRSLAEAFGAAARGAAAPAAALPAPPRRGAARPRPPVLDRGSELRPRLPPPAHRGAAARRRPAARRARRAHPRAARSTARARSGRSYVIEGCANGLRRALHQDPPLHDRRRLGRGDDAGAARPHARGRRRSRPRESAEARGACRARSRCSRRGALGLARQPDRIARTAFRTVREPRPAGGALGAVARSARPRPPADRGRLPAPARAAGRRGADPADARAAHAVQPLDHAAPPLRRTSRCRSRDVKQREDRVRHHAQRRGDGALGVRAAPLPRDKDALPDDAAHRDGAGVGAQRGAEARATRIA